MDKTVKEAFKDSIPVMAGYIVLGIGFGILLEESGYGIIYSLLMSIFIYAGSMQFVCCNLITASASLISVFIMTIAINIRHIFYGISMLKEYKGVKKHKIYDIFSLTDETFSIVSSKEFNSDINKDKYYFLLSLFDQCYWILGSVIGSLLGNIIPISLNGIEFSMTALFTCVVINQWKSTKNHIPAIGGFIISIICLVIFGSSNFIIPSVIFITIFLIIIRKKVGETNE